MPRRADIWKFAPADRPGFISHTASTGLGLSPSRRGGYWRSRLGFVQRNLTRAGWDSHAIEVEIVRFRSAVAAEVEMRRRLAEPAIAAEVTLLARLFEDAPQAATEALS